tara:strand:- start:4118 stop:5077 length:960 start_codon:yes stop_codon:yes gene_type:complete
MSYNNLISRNQNFILDSKILYINSDDRNIQKYPNANSFEINMPQAYKNVESIRLLNIQFPSNLYNISEELQNNKFRLTKGSTDSIINIPDGYYTINKLKNTINNINNINGNNLTLNYDDTYNKFEFSTTSTDCSLSFHDISYINCNSKCVYEQHSKWGLGYILGFNKYEKVDNIFDYRNPRIVNIKNGIGINSDNFVDIDNNRNIVMSIDKYNKADSILPYINNTNNNSNVGLVNSVFVKIPIIKNEYNQNFHNFESNYSNISFFQPPITALEKLKFEFKYDNDIPVDFNNYNITFTLEINQISNQIKKYEVRKPFINQ